jgi:hypothetical protein
MTVKQAAERREVSSAHDYALIAAGKRRCHRIGMGLEAIRIDEAQIAVFLSRTMPPVNEPAALAGRVRLKHLRVNSPG